MCIYMYIYIHTYVNMYICVYTRPPYLSRLADPGGRNLDYICTLYTSIQIHIYEHIYVYTYIHIDICSHTNLEYTLYIPHVYIYIYIHTTYTNIIQTTTYI